MNAAGRWVIRWRKPALTVLVAALAAIVLPTLALALRAATLKLPTELAEGSAAPESTRFFDGDDLPIMKNVVMDHGNNLENRARRLRARIILGHNAEYTNIVTRAASAWADGSCPANALGGSSVLARLSNSRCADR